MSIKKPSLKGMANTKYLGHFAQDKYIQQGHNFSGSLCIENDNRDCEFVGKPNIKYDKPEKESDYYSNKAEDAENSDDLSKAINKKRIAKFNEEFSEYKKDKK